MSEESSKKLYNRKKPAHPADKHTRAKRWFKQKSRRSLRRFLKDRLRTNDE